jgi:hypothetical protein
MKYLTTTALAALVAAAIGTAALVPAFADDTTAPAASAAPPALQDAARGDMNGPGAMNRTGPMGRMGGQMHRWGGPENANGRGDLRANLLDLACGDRGAEALEIALVHVQYAVKPTTEQAPLLDALKTAALADQKTFADACKTAMGDANTTAGQKTILDRLQARLAIDTAKVTALSDVLPKFKAFYDSLSDAQKAKLEPQRGGEHMGFNGQFGPRGMGQHGMGPHGAGRMHPADGTNGPGSPPAPGQPDLPAPADQGTDAPAT